MFSLNITSLTLMWQSYTRSRLSVCVHAQVCVFMCLCDDISVEGQGKVYQS